MKVTWLVLCTGCAYVGPEPGEPLLDTGWFEDEPLEDCTALIVSTVPEDGATGWYWRDPLTLTVGASDDVYDLRLTTEAGQVVPLTISVDDTGLVYEATVDNALAPSTRYVWEIEDCDGRHEQSFTTSDLGVPLDDGPDTVVGRTYQLDLARATWLEPGGFGATLGGLIANSPVLLSVRLADTAIIDWIGTTGVVGSSGISQSNSRRTWTFPRVDFATSPYFAIATDEIELDVQGNALPITDFVLTGTFAPDGSAVKGATLSGLGDTRSVGGAIGSPGVEGAFCDLAAGIGVDCIPCGDGEPYCLEVSIVNLSAPVVPGLRLVPIRLDP